MTPDVSLLAALFAGLVSFLSPCVLPLVPPYLVYLAGTSLERLAERSPNRGCGARRSRPPAVRAAAFRPCSWRSARARACSAQLLRAYSQRLAMVAGIAIIVMGLHFLGVFRIGLLHREKRMDVPKPVGLWGAYVMGLAFAFGWTPCIGPILAAILAVAASEQTVAQGRRPACGLFARARHSVPVGGLRGRAVRGFPRALPPRIWCTSRRMMGGLLVLTGVAFLTGFVTTASFWLLEAFPVLGRFG